MSGRGSAGSRLTIVTARSDLPRGMREPPPVITPAGVLNRPLGTHPNRTRPYRRSEHDPSEWIAHERWATGLVGACGRAVHARRRATREPRAGRSQRGVHRHVLTTPRAQHPHHAQQVSQGEADHQGHAEELHRHTPQPRRHVSSAASKTRHKLPRETRTVRHTGLSSPRDRRRRVRHSATLRALRTCGLMKLRRRAGERVGGRRAGPCRRRGEGLPRRRAGGRGSR